MDNTKKEKNVDHPDHYGGAENKYEAIKVIEAWGVGFNLGNCLKYISRSDKKGNKIEDLKKAMWYLDREIVNLEEKKNKDKEELRSTENKSKPEPTI